jgi:serine/threonine-protein kinase
MLRGLHAAHEARDENGEALGIVHRDISPQNVIVGTDGIARVTDFGIAQATSRVSPTQDEELKGKLAYMSPEQLARQPVDRRTDMYAASVVLWEALAGRRLFRGTPEAISAAVLASEVPPLPLDVPEAARVVTMRGLARHLAFRFATAREMALALEAAVPPAMPRVVGEWVRERAAESLERQSAKLKAIAPIVPPAG